MEVDERLLLSHVDRVLPDHDNQFSQDMGTEFEDRDDFAAFDSYASLAGSDWGNVSSSSSDSSAEHQLSAKDIANWREFSDIWANYHRLRIASVEDVRIDPQVSQIIHGVFQLAYHIPCSWFIHPTEQCPENVGEYLSRIAQADPTFLGDNGPAVSSRPGHALILATIALDIHERALRLAHGHNDQFLDEQWATEIHDALITRCAQGQVLGASEAWTLPVAQVPDSDTSPTVSQILNVHKVRPRGAVPVLCHFDFAAAAFSTRSQITSPLRDTPELLALHAFNVMATSAALRELSTLSIDSMPVFGALFDRNIVRFHVDWTVPNQDYDSRDSITFPLPHAEQPSSGVTFPFWDFDITRPDDALRVAFMLDAIHSYAQDNLMPPVASAIQSRETLSPGEISAQEKVQAWMQSGVTGDSES